MNDIEECPADKKEWIIRVEQLSKIGIAGLSFTYALGFIAASLYFARYSVSSLSLIRVQYILAGIWLLLPILTTLFVLVWIVYFFRNEYSKNVDVPSHSKWSKIFIHLQHLFEM